MRTPIGLILPIWLITCIISLPAALFRLSSTFIKASFHYMHVNKVISSFLMLLASPHFSHFLFHSGLKFILPFVSLFISALMKELYQPLILSSIWMPFSVINRASLSFSSVNYLRYFSIYSLCHQQFTLRPRLKMSARFLLYSSLDWYRLRALSFSLSLFCTRQQGSLELHDIFYFSYIDDLLHLSYY